jgi:hypothetical protein
MNIILKRSLIFVILMMAGLALYAFQFGMKADKYDETAIPYLKENLPIVAKWRYSDLKSRLSPQAQNEFETDRGRSTYSQFSKLGRIESLGKPQFKTDLTEFSEGLGDVEVLSYSIPAEFESGPAVIKVDLASDGQSYFIHRLGVSSEIFLEQKE